MSMELVLLATQLVSAVEKIGATLECLNSTVSQLVKNTQHQDVPAVSNTQREEHKKQAPTNVVVPSIPLPATSVNESAFREPLLQIHGPIENVPPLLQLHSTVENVPEVSSHQKMDEPEEPAAVSSLPSADIFYEGPVLHPHSIKDYSSELETTPDIVTNAMLPHADDNNSEGQRETAFLPVDSALGVEIDIQGQTETFVKEENISDDYEENAIGVGNGFELLQVCKKEVDEIDEEHDFPQQMDESLFDENANGTEAHLASCNEEVGKINDEDDDSTPLLEDESFEVNADKTGAPLHDRRKEVVEFDDEDDDFTLQLEGESSFEEDAGETEAEMPDVPILNSCETPAGPSCSRDKHSVFHKHKVRTRKERENTWPSSMIQHSKGLSNSQDGGINNEEKTRETSSSGGKRGRRQRSGHGTEKKNECSTCGKVCKRASELKRHMRTHSGEKPFHCPLCAKAFAQQGNLKTHLQVHSDEKAFRCTECGASFRQKFHLKSHMFTHSQKWPFNCDQCGKGYPSSGHLKIHMRTHTGEKPFSCDECGASLRHKSDLSKHRRLHSGERPFSCDQCNAKFTCKANLKGHMLIHLDLYPFVCDHCGEGFRQRIRLKRHQCSEKH